MEYAVWLSGGLALGCLHALDADHIAAVSALIIEKQPLRKTLNLALRWSLGHSLTLLVLAGLMFGIRDIFVALSLEGAERLVGLSMIGVGFWVLYRERKRRAARDNPGDLHYARSGMALFGMGVLHGAAGSSSIFLLVPVAISRSPALVTAYVFLFSAGMILTMGAYSALVNRGVLRLSSHEGKLRYVSAIVAMAVGLRLL